MKSDVRQRWLYGEGTDIRNNRQVSIVDADELAQIAAKLGIDALAPGTIADNICTTGISNLTSLPQMTRLVFSDPDDPSSDGAVVVLGGENMPCTIAGALVGDRYGTGPEKFPKAAIHLRGVTGWVERPGVLRSGLAIRVVPPRPTG
jgi:MOSC domain-containing protein YiiM